MAGDTYLGERRRTSDGRSTERYSDFTRDHELNCRYADSIVSSCGSSWVIETTNGEGE